VKLFASETIGVRLTGQVSATFVHFDARAVGCSPGLCFVGVNTDIVWQAEFSAGLIVRVHRRQARPSQPRCLGSFTDAVRVAKHGMRIEAFREVAPGSLSLAMRLQPRSCRRGATT
jgi:hypothetical protein